MEHLNPASNWVVQAERALTSVAWDHVTTLSALLAAGLMVGMAVGVVTLLAAKR